MIILISWSFNERNYYRLGIDVLEKKEINFKILNLFDLLYPDQKEINNGRIYHKNEIIIKSYKEFLRYINSNELLLNFLNIKKKTLPIFILLTMFNKKYISFDNMPLPTIENKKLEYLNYLFKSAYIGAVVDKKHGFPFSKKTNFIYINSIDYDTYLRFEKENNKPLLNNNYIVFIDQNLPYHLDFIRNNEKPYVTDKNYYKSLNKFFDYIENKYNKEVVIALHPNSANKHQFNKKCFINETINLIKHSDSVLLHSSTAVSFAIIYDKSICMIETDEIIKSQMHKFNYLLSSILNLNLFNIDNIFDIEFKKGNYEYYKNKYVSKSSNNLLSMEILLKELDGFIFK